VFCDGEPHGGAVHEEGGGTSSKACAPCWWTRTNGRSGVPAHSVGSVMRMWISISPEGGGGFWRNDSKMGRECD